jgi:hypothetical protein
VKHSSYIVASRSCRTDPKENIASRSVHWCWLGIRCIETGLHARISFGNMQEYVGKEEE